MRAIPLAVLLAALTLTPLALAGGVTFEDALHVNDALLFAQLKVPVSNPVLQSSKNYDIVLHTGDSVSATLTYTDTAGGSVPNDLDLTLLLPSAAPIPLNIPPTAAQVQAIVASRVVRETCTDHAAQSAQHPLLGGSTTEQLSFTVPSGGEQGAYVLVVRGFLMTKDQPYTLSVTVTSNGQDVSAARATLDPQNANGGDTMLITTNPHCEMM